MQEVTVAQIKETVAERDGKSPEFDYVFNSDVVKATEGFAIEY